MSEGTADGEEARVVWDDSAMSSSFANVVNIQSTREQVDLFFGINRSASPAAPTGGVSIALTSHVAMNPHAAKRLLRALGEVVGEYEARYGLLGGDRDGGGKP